MLSISARISQVDGGSDTSDTAGDAAGGAGDVVLPFPVGFHHPLSSFNFSHSLFLLLPPLSVSVQCTNDRLLCWI